MSVKASAETLRSIPIFADCEPVHLQVLAFSAIQQQFPAGADILVQDQVGNAGYLLLSGAVSLFRDDGAGIAQLGEAGPGAFLGETAMIAGGAYAMTARATVPVDTVRIERALFVRVAEEYPEFGTRVFRALARRLEGTLGEFTDAKLLFDRARSFSNL
jgi:CRP/FNR family transcriptional regulator, cyclic AMP receptor protein